MPDETPNDSQTDVTPGAEGAGGDAPSGGGEGGGGDANIPARLSVREIFEREEAKAKAAEDEPSDDEPAGDAPAEDADADADDEPAPGDDPEKGEDADPDADPDKPAEEPDPAAVAAAAAEAEAATAKTELDELLATYDDPAVLNAALAKAGVEKVSELPAVKDIIGRISQSVRDQTRAEIERSAREAAQIADATREGKAAKDKLVAAFKAATEALESDDPEAVIELPSEEAVNDAFKDYADSAVGEYHTRAWNALSDSIYSLPEFGGKLPDDYAGPPVPELNDAQKQLLEAAKGQPAAVWLAAHLTVQRDVLWDWATAHQNGDKAAEFEAEKVQIQAAHKSEIARLTKAHEKALTDAREEARAEAIADVGAGRVTPKTPNKTGATTERDPNENKPKKGAGIREVHQWAKEQHEATAVTGRDT